MSFPNPTFVFIEQKDFDAVSTEFPHFSGRQMIQPRRRRKFRLRYENVKASDRDLIRAEFLAAKGGAMTTTFTPVDEGSPVTVRFDEDSLEWALKHFNDVDLEFNLVEEIY